MRENEKQSNIAQQYTLPSRATRSVTSAHHSSLGIVAANRRFTRSAGVQAPIKLGFAEPPGAAARAEVFGHDRVDQIEVDVHLVWARSVARARQRRRYCENVGRSR